MKIKKLNKNKIIHMALMKNLYKVRNKLRKKVMLNLKVKRINKYKQTKMVNL